MEDLILIAKSRAAAGKQNKRLRKSGFLPGVLYGPKQKSVSLEVDEKEFERVYRQAGENTLINLKLNDKENHKVLIHEVGRHFMKPKPVHVDFYAVNLKKKIHAKIPLRFEGTPPAVKEQGGVLLTIVNEVEVNALPTDLPHFIEVDLRGLAQFNDQVRLQDLKVGEEVEILGNPEDVVATVKPPRTQAEIEALDETASEEDEVKAVAGEEGEAGEGTEGEEKAEGDEEKKEDGEAAEKASGEEKKE